MWVSLPLLLLRLNTGKKGVFIFYQCKLDILRKQEKNEINFVSYVKYVFSAISVRPTAVTVKNFETAETE